MFLGGTVACKKKTPFYLHVLRFRCFKFSDIFRSSWSSFGAACVGVLYQYTPVCTRV